MITTLPLRGCCFSDCNSSASFQHHLSHLYKVHLRRRSPAVERLPPVVGNTASALRKIGNNSALIVPFTHIDIIPLMINLVCWVFPRATTPSVPATDLPTLFNDFLYCVISWFTQSLSINLHFNFYLQETLSKRNALFEIFFTGNTFVLNW